MKYELETIPVWDAYRAGGECPVCILEKKNEAQNVKYFLGDSVMDPDTRVAANEKGFCVYHSELLFEGGHKLGLALMTHTYLARFLADLRRKRAEEPDAKARSKRPSVEWPAFFRATRSACLFCERLAATIDRYVFTIVYLYKKDEDFRKTFHASNGFCLPHLARALEMAEENLSGAIREEFTRELLALEEKRLAVLEGEIDWFTQKFDYRNQDKPWGNSADALPRVLQKLKGHRFLDRK
ncbi:MAG: hypothetical protein JXD23_08950 [Spirochaetales bacterium]|nr:hypothetical protein [Spirochaetales bacterium]